MSLRFEGGSVAPPGDAKVSSEAAEILTPKSFGVVFGIARLSGRSTSVTLRSRAEGLVHLASTLNTIKFMYTPAPVRLSSFVDDGEEVVGVEG